MLLGLNGFILALQGEVKRRIFLGRFDVIEQIVVGRDRRFERISLSYFHFKDGADIHRVEAGDLIFLSHGLAGADDFLSLGLARLWFLFLLIVVLIPGDGATVVGNSL